MTTFIILTTCLYERNFAIRQAQYTRGINSVIKRYIGNNNVKIVIVENNGKRASFLDNFGVPVLYTNNNFLQTWNIGHKELQDVLACISHFNIQEDDFIVKITGRYYLDTDCPFFDKVDENIYDCIIRYGNYRTPPMSKTSDCIAGLVGMRCKFVKNVKIPDTESVEINWANESFSIKKIYVMDKMGIFIAPASNEFFLV